MTRRPARALVAWLAALAATGVLGGIQPAAVADDPPAPSPTLTPTPTPTPPPNSGPCSLTTPAYIAEAPAIVTSLDMQQAWSFSQGDRITVAVVDSGVDADNPHLGAAVLPGLDLMAKKSDGRVDIGGIGTATAGLVAARPVDSSGLVGLAPEANILPVRVYVQATATNRDDTTVPTPSVTAQGIVWAADHRAQVILVPTAFTVDDDTLHQAVDYAAAAGSLVIAPTGDANSQNGVVDAAPRYPAAYSEAVLGVTAVNADGTPSSDAVYNSTVMLAAPGVGVVSTYYGLGDCMFAGDRASTVYAAGYAGGVAALIAARFPEESPAEWAYRMEVTASRPLAAQRDDMVGWGVLSPTDALTFVDDGTALGPVNPSGNKPAPPPPTNPAPATPAPPSRTVTTREVMIVAACAALLVVVWLAALLWGRPLSARWPTGILQKWRNRMPWSTWLARHSAPKTAPPKRGL